MRIPQKIFLYACSRNIYERNSRFCRQEPTSASPSSQGCLTILSVVSKHPKIMKSTHQHTQNQRESTHRYLDEAILPAPGTSHFAQSTPGLLSTARSLNVSGFSQISLYMEGFPQSICAQGRHTPLLLVSRRRLRVH